MNTISKDSSARTKPGKKCPARTQSSKKYPARTQLVRKAHFLGYKQRRSLGGGRPIHPSILNFQVYINMYTGFIIPQLPPINVKRFVATNICLYVYIVMYMIHVYVLQEVKEYISFFNIQRKFRCPSPEIDIRQNSLSGRISRNQRWP